MTMIPKDQLDDMIAETQATGNVSKLASALKGRPMSPGGFVRTPQGSFGDGVMDDGSWLDVEAAVIEGRLSVATYDKLYDCVFGT